MDKLVKLLKSNARLTNAEIAVMLGRTEQDVTDEITALENKGIIKGYSTIIDESAADPSAVSALIELKVTPQSQSGYDAIAGQISSYEQVSSVRLLSGGYDILVAVNGSNIREVSQFVSQRLAAIDAVQSTVTHFVLKSYKYNGVLISEEENDERGLVSP